MRGKGKKTNYTPFNLSSLRQPKRSSAEQHVTDDNEMSTNSPRNSLQSKSTTSTTLTTSSQSTSSAQATKLNVPLESNSLPKKRKVADQVANIETLPPTTTSKNTTSKNTTSKNTNTNNTTTTTTTTNNKSLSSRKALPMLVCFFFFFF
jgi:hypothetical protein